jgi:aminopeptidase N
MKERERMPRLERNCSDHCMNTYISNNSDWVTVATDFTTSSDQIAIAPGSLINKKVVGNRTTYSYKLDHYALNFYSFMSAAYQVERKKWKDIDLEVYYTPEHKYNVKKMIASLENSLSYYTEHFGPYYNNQARIIEFPRYASFAQAFPGTMPYSEGIGFIANLEDSNAIDMVYYVVAHEMGHQWWAHQVTGANMQGATLLSETMAQYSALMVMEKMYGKKMMYKFLKYEMDNYLRSRGNERVKESPLLRVENQGYIHYRKGSVVMYYLKEMIGEKAVNSALKDMIDSLAYQQPPYPNAYMLVDRFNAVTPDSLKYLIQDLFYDITLFGNRTTNATYKKLAGGKYEVSFDVEAMKFKADSMGKETDVKINDWIEIGVRAKAKDGEKIGKQIYSQMIKFDKSKSTYKVLVNELPYEAGIDPNFMLIDRIPGDNMKKLDLKE